MADVASQRLMTLMTAGRRNVVAVDDGDGNDAGPGLRPLPETTQPFLNVSATACSSLL